MSVPALDEVERSLDAFDAEQVRRAVWSGLMDEGPPHRFSERLDQALGVWYQAGPRVGDESVRPWCWCHSFRRPPTIGERWASVLEELRFGIAWRRSVIAAVHGIDDLEEPEQAVLQLLDTVIGLGIHDAWYVHIDAALAWLMDHLGIPRDDARTEALYLACERRFTSWTTPGPETRRAFADEVAWTLVEQQLDSQGRDSQGGGPGA